MSFILEALKKSEQQRQQQKTPQPQVRKRILASSSRSSGRRSYWLIIAFLLVGFSCGWWLYSSQEKLVEQVVAVEKAEAPAVSQVERSEPVRTAGMEKRVPRQQVATSAPAPVPREAVIAPEIAPRKTAATVVIKPLKEEQVNERPLYRDLPERLRNRIPPLDMSMHYYVDSPARRLVRINNVLLHEADWLGPDLQVVEIIQAGVVLDFSGEIFELRSVSR